MVPQKEITIKITESNPSPTNVDRIVLTHNFFHFVATFNLDKIIEFENSPNKYPAKEAIATLGVVPITIA